MNAHKSLWLPGIVLLVGGLAGCDAFVSVEGRLERAQAALAEGEVGRASIELRKAVQDEPQNAVARLLLTRIALAVGDGANARKELDLAIKGGAQGPDVDDLRVEVSLAAGEAQALIDALTQNEIALAEPARSVALGRAYNALGQPDRALEAFASALTANSAHVPARLGRAQSLVLRGESDQALAEIDAVATAAPDAHGAYALKGEILLRRGQFAEAEAVLRLALERLPRDAAVFERGKLLAGVIDATLAQRKVEAAAGFQQELARILPAAAVTRFLSARVLLAQGNQPEGIAELQRVVAAAPGFMPARMLLGAALLEQGNLSQAESQLAAVVQHAPDNVEARKLLANVRLQLDQPDAALRVLTPAIGSETTDPQVFALLQAIRGRVEDSDATLEALEKGMQENPENTNLKLALAEAYLADGRAREARVRLEGIAPAAGGAQRDALLVAALGQERGPGAARAHIERLLAAKRDVSTLNLAATFFASQREFDRARDLLKEALAADARSAMTLVNSARVDAAQGDVAAAERSLRQALALEEQSTPVRVALADLLIRRSARDEALQVLETGAGKSQDPELHFAIGRLQLLRGDVARATAAIDRALQLQPGRAELVNRAGLVLLEGREYAAALAHFRRATELVPQNAVYWLNTGRAQLALDQSEAARESLSKALTSRPDWMPAVSALVLVDVRTKRFDAALERIEALSQRRPDDAQVHLLRGDVLTAAERHREAVSAYEVAESRQGGAVAIVKQFEARRAAGLANPEQPLLRWLSRQPGDFRVRSILAQHHLGEGRLEQAAGEFEAVIRAAPDSPAQLNNLAWIYDQLGDARAESVAQRAHELAPQSPAIADTLGWILSRKGDTARALPLLAAAARGAPNSPEIQYHYAAVLARAGRRSEAKDALVRTLADSGAFAERREAEGLLAELEK